MLKVARPAALACCAMFAIVTSANAEKAPPLMPVGYDDPGPEPRDVVPTLVAALRIKLKDPYSMRDLTVCRPSSGEASYDRYDKKWSPAGWSVMFALNAKNSYGGYVGRRNGFAYFKGGRLDDIDFDDQRVESELDADLVRTTEKLLASCERIADDRVQKLLQ